MVVGNITMASIFKSLFWVCLVCSILGLEIQVQACDRRDFQALKQFAANLVSGSVISAWGNSFNCCQWDGVLCENNNGGSGAGRVVKVVLRRKGLHGNISGSIGQLDQLRVLDLSCNDLTGVLPPELAKLEQLTHLDLSNNGISGSVFEAFAGLKSIQSLNASSNLFNGTLAKFGEFPEMEVFNISNNSFSGQLTSQICVSKMIRVIDLSKNHLTGGLQNLNNCTSSLQQLDVCSNLLSGKIPAFMYSMSSLEQLSICDNNFTGLLSGELSKLYRLKMLSISGNNFSGDFPNVFSSLLHLEHLSASTNSFSGVLPYSLGHSTSLQVLELRKNSFSGPISINFTGLPNLINLDLASNSLNGTLPSSLSNCRNLKVLSLARNELTGEVPKSFRELASLSFLSLSNNSIVNLSSALATLQHCKNLTTLILSKNFHGEDMPKIENLNGFSSLMLLALGNCGLGGQIPEWLLNCNKLQVLDLSWNRLDGNIPPWIGQMENLFYLDFSNNTLTGELPKSITQLKSLINLNCSSLDPSANTGIPLYVKRNQSANGLQYNQASSFPPSLLLSDNSITGIIWPEIGNLKQLVVLDLNRNNITGTIPDTISNISNLEVLDLSYNDLHGSIPLSLAKLTFLSRFSVAYNQLEGRVPQSGQFMSISSSSYEGNSGLCGGPVLSPCELNNDHAKSSRLKNKVCRNTILGITIGIGVGVLLLLAVIVKLSRRRATDPTSYLVEEGSRASRLSEAFGSSKLDLFENSDCGTLSIGDLLKATGNFSQSNIIGCGGFGLVYKATIPNGTKVAVKRLSGDCGQMEREFQAEVEALSRAQHKNLVSLQGYCLLGNDRLLIYSFMENGSLDYWLHECIDGSSVLNWSARLKIAQGAAHGLAYLHKVCEPKIIHRDIKSSNILLDEKFEAHLADFGLSRFLRPYDTHVTTDLVGTLGYIPPEYSQALTATFKGDIYSFGVVLLELLTGRRPVEVCKGKNCRDLVSWVFQMKLEKKEEIVIDALIWDKDHEKQLLDVLDVACKCLDRDPRQRPSVDQVVHWLDAVNSM